MSKYALDKADILSYEDFMVIRAQKHKEILEIKKNRRLAIGPDISVYFENKQTLWWQTQEMLRIEQGGSQQLEDELAAYGPLVPKGHELVATVMIEVADIIRRRQLLQQLGHIEDQFLLRFSGHEIMGIPEQDTERTDASGKTSAVHFIRWRLTTSQVLDFRHPRQDVIIDIRHPAYPFKALLPEAMRTSLVEDL